MSLPVPKMEDLKDVFEKIISYSPQHLINFVIPQELEARLEEMLVSPSISTNNLSEIVDFTLHHSVNTSHPYFVNQLYGGPNPVGLAGAFLVERMNTNQ